MPQNCMLGELCAEDLPALSRLFTSTSCREFLGGPLDSDAALQRSKDWIALSSSTPIWAVRGRVDQRFLGYVILDDHHNGVDTEISYALLPENWGQGYATEAMTEAFARASQELGLGALVAETQTKNCRSIRLLQRLGMVEETRTTRFGAEQIIFRIELTNSKPGS